ncbi:MAG: NAD-dependent epimerase/dehydratase family protein [Planctomycetota bacterium]|nr:NAD-dependent epimerase/dehydratase family protein [Planctomycetota bacterium]
MKVTVTGGAGFIGSHLVEELLARDYNVTVLDNLSTGSLKNLSSALKNPHFNFIEGSVLDEVLLSETLKGSETVFHLAASVGVRRIVDDPITTIRTNVVGTDTLLSVASKCGCRRVLVASSSEVYGKSFGTPFSEEDDLLFGATHKSRWSYGISKALDEILALAYHSKNLLMTIIVRFFNIVGERQTGEYGMVLPRFIKQALSREPLTVYGNGEQVRTFCYVKDAVEALIRLSLCEQAYGKVVNLGSPYPIRIRELAELVKKTLSSSSEIRFIPYEDVYGVGFEDILYRVPDITLLKNLTGYTPQTPIDKIILRVASSQNPVE